MQASHHQNLANEQADAGVHKVARSDAMPISQSAYERSAPSTVAPARKRGNGFWGIVQPKCATCGNEKLLRRSFWEPFGAISSQGGFAPQLPERKGPPQGAMQCIGHDLASQKGQVRAPHLSAPKSTPPGFGADFVKVPFDKRSSSHPRNAMLGPKDSTLGRDLHFGQAQFTPWTGIGHAPLPAEVRHTVQQGAACPIQILSQTKEGVDGTPRGGTYPWRGLIESKGNSSIGFQKNPKPPTSRDDSIWPALEQGDDVLVIGTAENNWLKVEREYKGTTQIGFVDWRYVVPAATSKSVDDYTYAKIVKDEGVGKFWYPTKASFQENVQSNPGVLAQFRAEVGVYNIYLELIGRGTGTSELKTLAATILKDNGIIKFKGDYAAARKLFVQSLDKQRANLGILGTELAQVKNELQILSAPREMAKKKLEESQVLLSRIQSHLANPLLKPAIKQKLQTVAIGLITQIISLEKKLGSGGARIKGMAAIGGTLAVGLAIPVPEEVVTWPVAGIGAVILLLFTAAAVTDSEIGESVMSLVEWITKSILAIEAADLALCLLLYEQCVERRKGWVPCDDCLWECKANEGAWPHDKCEILPLK